MFSAYCQSVQFQFQSCVLELILSSPARRRSMKTVSYCTCFVLQMPAYVLGKPGSQLHSNYAWQHLSDSIAVLSAAAGDIDCVRLLVEAGASQVAMDDVRFINLLYNEFLY